MNERVKHQLRTKYRVDERGCWVWQGYTTADGYARVSVGKYPRNAHRLSYELEHGPVPKELVVDHLCRNRACINPAHLEPVTTKTNNLRGISPPALNAIKTHCVRGHDLQPENVHHCKEGYRRCKLCIDERRQHWPSYIRSKEGRKPHTPDPAIVQKAIDLYLTGMTQEAVGAAIGRSSATVFSYLKKAGVLRPYKYMDAQRKRVETMLVKRQVRLAEMAEAYDGGGC